MTSASSSFMSFSPTFFFSSRRRHTRLQGDWSSDVCSSDLVTERSPVRATNYPVPKKQNAAIRAKRPEIEKALKGKKTKLVDVRSTPEFVGEIIAPPGMTETAQRAGHIPGAKNVPWSKAVATDGTFKPFE